MDIIIHRVSCCPSFLFGNCTSILPGIINRLVVYFILVFRPEFTKVMVESQHKSCTLGAIKVTIA